MNPDHLPPGQPPREGKKPPGDLNSRFDKAFDVFDQELGINPEIPQEEGSSLTRPGRLEADSSEPKPKLVTVDGGYGVKVARKEGRRPFRLANGEMTEVQNGDVLLVSKDDNEELKFLHDRGQDEEFNRLAEKLLVKYSNKDSEDWEEQEPEEEPEERELYPQEYQEWTDEGHAELDAEEPDVAHGLPEPPSVEPGAEPAQAQTVTPPPGGISLPPVYEAESTFSEAAAEDQTGAQQVTEASQKEPVVRITAEKDQLFRLLDVLVRPEDVTREEFFARTWRYALGERLSESDPEYEKKVAGRVREGKFLDEVAGLHKDWLKDWNKAYEEWSEAGQGLGSAPARRKEVPQVVEAAGDGMEEVRQEVAAAFDRPGRGFRLPSMRGALVRLRRHEEVPPAEPAETAEQKRFWRDKIWQGFTEPALKNWAENLVFWHKKDRWWYLGAATGTLQTAVLFSALGPMGGFAKAGINFAVAQGFYGGVRIHRALEAKGIREQVNYDVSEDVIQERLRLLDEKNSRSGSRIRSFFAGISAAGTYGSFGGILGSALEQTTGLSLDVRQITTNLKVSEHAGGAVTKATAITPEPTAKAPIAQTEPGETPTPTAAATAGPTVGPTRVPGIADGQTPTATPSPEPSPTQAPFPTAVLSTPTPSGSLLDVTQMAEAQKIADEYIDKKFQEGISAVVGKHLDKVKETTDEMLRAKGVDPANLLPEQYEKVRLAMQHQFEAQANRDFGAGSPDTVLQTPDDLANALKIGEAAYSKDLEVFTPENIQAWADQPLSAELGQAIKDISIPTTANPQSFDAIKLMVESHSSLPAGSVVDVPKIPSGTSVGQMMVNNGYNLTNWNSPASVEAFGAQIAANYDVLSDFWKQMEVAGSLPKGTAFPIKDIGDLHTLIEKAKMGDNQSLQTLKDALRWIPAGKKFSIIKQAGLQAVLSKLT